MLRMSQNGRKRNDSGQGSRPFGCEAGGDRGDVADCAAVSELSNK